MSEAETARRVRMILAAIKPLAAECYRLTGKPLGVMAKSPSMSRRRSSALSSFRRVRPDDAIRRTAEGPERIQINGRA